MVIAMTFELNKISKLADSDPNTSLVKLVDLQLKLYSWFFTIFVHRNGAETW